MGLEFKERYGFTYWTQDAAISAGAFELVKDEYWQVELNVNLDDPEMTRVVGNLLQNNTWESFDDGDNDRLSHIDVREDAQFENSTLDYFGV